MFSGLWNDEVWFWFDEVICITSPQYEFRPSQSPMGHGDVGAYVTISPIISFTATGDSKKDDRVDLYKAKNNGVLYNSHYYPYKSYTGSLLMDQ